MKSLGFLLSLGFVLVAPRLASGQSVQPQPTAHTYALLFASNAGGPGQQALRYAEDDARKVEDVLTSLAGYDPSRVRKVLAPSAAEMRAALATLHDQLTADAQAGEQSVVFLYYSGHARADALSLGAETMPLDELRERVTALPATLSIVVLDACQSGAFSRVKGAAAAGDFSFNSVQQLNTEGIAVMASSTALELSQESDELKSSYFTHHLLVALRGGADVDRDGRVTLAEAYHYAYDHTLAQTATTTVGEQHVTLETDFRGKGDVPITYPAQASSRLLIPADFSGKLILQKLPSWSVLAELQKAPGDPVELALPAGEYAATVRRDGSAERCALRIADGEQSTLDLSSGCTPLIDRAVRAKGDDGGDSQPRWYEHGDEGFVFEVAVGIGGGHQHDAYEDRLRDFGFERGYHAGGRYSFGLGRRLLANLLVGATFANLDAETYDRDTELHQRFEWNSHAFGAFAQADAAVGRGRYVMVFVRGGGGFAYGSSTFDAIKTESAFADESPSFEDTTANTRKVHDGFGGLYGWAGLGGMLNPNRNLGFTMEFRYTVSPLLDNRTGETHDLGGLDWLIGLRARSWE